MRKIYALLAGEGSTGAGGAGGAAGADPQAGAAGAGAAAGSAAAGAAGAGTGGAAGVAGAGAGGGAGTFLDAAGTSGQQGQGAQGAAGQQSGAAAAPYELKLPEGVRDAEKPMFEALGKFAKDSKVDPGVAQGFIDFLAKQTGEANKALVARVEQRVKDDRHKLETHPRIGGAELTKSLEVAKRGVAALDKAADGLGQRVVQKLAEAGIGWDPDFAELLVMVGRNSAEDSTGRMPAALGAKPDARTERRSKLFPAATAEAKRDQHGK